jgi:hypothetical protein
LIAVRHETARMTTILLTCGILSSLWYLAVNIIVPMQDDHYNSITQTVSELSAIGVPTRVLWVLLCPLFTLLYIAFGWGVWQVSPGNRSIRVISILIILYGVMNIYWPPMHQREVIAAGGGTLTDTLHIGWAMITLVFNMLIMGFGAAALGKRFRIYTFATWVVYIVFGVLTFMESPGIEAGLPTPGIGIWERINISASMLWVIVLAVVLMRNGKVPRATASPA